MRLSTCKDCCLYLDDKRCMYAQKQSYISVVAGCSANFGFWRVAYADDGNPLTRCG